MKEKRTLAQWLSDLRDRLLKFVRWLLSQLKDRTNIVIFLIVVFVLSCEIWVPYLLAILTQNAWWWAVGSACWAFWLAPFTPFWPLCILLTGAVRKGYDAVKNRRAKRKYSENANKSSENEEK